MIKLIFVVVFMIIGLALLFNGDGSSRGLGLIVSLVGIACLPHK